MLCLTRHKNERVAVFLRGEFVCWVTFNGRKLATDGAQFELRDVLVSLGFDGHADAKFVREEVLTTDDRAAIPEAFWGRSYAGSKR